MKSSERFTSEAISFMKASILDAEGCEVLFCAQHNKDGLLEHIVVAARGTENEVSALFPHMLAGDVVIHNHPSGTLRPSRADMGIATQLGNQGIGFYIIDNSADKVYCVAEPVKIAEKKPLDPDQLAAVLDEGGPLSRLSSSYEVRPAQLNLVRFVADAFNNDLLAIAEGGTGVGKSFAYLIPSLMWAHQNRERIIISTATIALQEQLFKKDLPMVLKLLNIKLKSVIAKGRQNYLCFKRLQETLDEESLFADEDSELMRIRDWSETSLKGDKSELNFMVESGLWSSVNSESDNCLGIRCKFYDRCFVFKARKEAAASSVIISNHHMLFADISLRAEVEGEALSILPPYQKIIFDEAHNMESSAVSFFSEGLSGYSVTRLLNRYHRRKRGQFFGILPALEALLPANHAAQSDRFYKLLDQAREAVEQLQSRGALYEEGSFRLHGEISLSLRQAVVEPLNDLSVALADLCSLVLRLLDVLDEEELDKSFLYEAKALLSRTQAMAALAGQFSNFTEINETVFWGEKSKAQNGSAYFRYMATPLDISSKMKNALYDKHESIIMVSATLAVNRNFHFFKKRIGLSSFYEQRLREALFPSPFDYENQALLLIPSDAPDPQLQAQAYDEYTAEFLLKLYNMSEGRGLALFTSYRALTEAYDRIRAPLQAQGFLVLRQGEDDRNRLINKFETHGHAVLLATDSFWEGVDINNKALKSVVICRLPFAPPSAPLTQARHEQILASGGNPFLELQEPEAAIKLKQGFGRLIRKGSDFGAVFILDSRIIKKSYGARLMNTLPQAAKKIDTSSNLIQSFINFINNY